MTLSTSSVCLSTSKVSQLKQAAFMHLNAWNNGSAVHALRTEVLQMAKGKQTNKHAVQGLGTCSVQTTPLLTACQSCRLRPLTRTLPRPCCWNKAPTVCACSGESAWDDVRPPPPWLRLRPFGQAGVRRECGGWAFIVGPNDGLGLCGNHAPARLSTCEKGQCAANLQCRFPRLQVHFGKRRINGWHKAGLRWWQMSFPFWFLTPPPPFLFQTLPSPPQKSLPPYCVLQSHPSLCFWSATLDSKGKKKTKFRAPIHIGGSNCHSHWDGVKYVKMRMRERSIGNSLLCSMRSVRC